MSAAGVQTDPVERRRQAGSGSARSQLLTVLGELALPHGEPVWTTTLLGALTALGHEEKSARQALNRTATEGVLSSERHGRRVLWSLTPRGEALLEEGTARIYGFMRGHSRWDGRWLVLNVPIPESQRQLRHRLRTRLAWLGLGTPTPGLWISPDTSRVSDVRAVIAELGLEDLTASWTGPAAGIGEESRLLAEAWDLETVEEEYRGFLEDFADRTPDDDLDAFVAQVELVHAWRRFPFLDPALPAELLDHDWPGPSAADLFHDRHTAWKPGALRAWRSLVRDGGPRP